MSNTIVLVGHIASGKTSIARALENKGYRRIITYTTRPPKKGEVDGVDYHFITETDFLHKQRKGFFAEGTGYDTIFGYWRYGSAFEDYQAKDKTVIVLNPRGVLNLKTKAFVVHLDINEDMLISRAVERGDNIEEVRRRIEIDRELFEMMQELRPPDMRIRHAIPIASAVDYILTKQDALSRELHAL